MKKTLALSTILGLLTPFVAFAKPTIGSVTPITATTGVPVNLEATVSSGVAIQRCTLWVDLAEIGEMTVMGGKASRSYTFPSGGSRIAFVFCRDTSGGMNSGPTTSINVAGAIQIAPPLATPTPTTTTTQAPTTTTTQAPTTTTTQTPAPASTMTQTPTTTTTQIPTSTTQTSSPTSSPLPTSSAPAFNLPTATSQDVGKLLKQICPINANQDHPCRAVYYIGKDGRRRAFPNSRVFFTWYGGFESVEEVESSRLSQFPLGQNVQYRAGVKMVKFTTDPKVYAVARGGVLRWVKSEELARTYYGQDWNRKIDDIPDSFYTNYTFGQDINVLADYNPAQELANSKE